MKQLDLDNLKHQLRTERYSTKLQEFRSHFMQFIMNLIGGVRVRFVVRLLSLKRLLVLLRIRRKLWMGNGLDFGSSLAKVINEEDGGN